MVKFLVCLKMLTLLTVELCFSGKFLVFQNLTMVKFLGKCQHFAEQNFIGRLSLLIVKVLGFWKK